MPRPKADPPAPVHPLADLATVEAALRGMDAVLLDLGGVLLPDAWEALVLGPGGIAERGGIDPAVALAAGRSIWDAFADRPRSEAEYRTALAEALGLPAIQPAPFDETADRALVPLPAGQALLTACRRAGLPIGVITDTAAFLFARQARVLEMDVWLDPELRFTSHETGLRKKSGLFEHARAATAGRAVLVVDDRPTYVERALAAGFRALRYSGVAATSGPGRRC